MIRKTKHLSLFDVFIIEVFTSCPTFLQGDTLELSSDIVGSPSSLRHLF